MNTAAIANGGSIIKPRLVRETYGDKPSDSPAANPTELRKLGIRSQHMDVVREGMRRVVHGPVGTAPSSGGLQTKWPKTNPPDEPQIMIGGKTGTAEIGTPDENGIYDRQHAWFTCYAPYDDPEVAVSVIVEDAGEGSAYAVPVTDRVLRAYFEITGRRKRGMVLREDNDLLRIDQTVLAEEAAFPEAGNYSAAPIQPD
jgi:cell division protein FtsI/penicillin-binding protein 2